MPVYQVGDLVQFRDMDDPGVGVILEMRHMAPRLPDARVLWNDMPEPRWFIISDLVPMQPAGEPGITG